MTLIRGHTDCLKLVSSRRKIGFQNSLTRIAARTAARNDLLIIFKLIRWRHLKYGPFYGPL